jgi:hypothetical protein
MTKKKAVKEKATPAVKEAEKAEITREIKGPLVFQRTNQGMAIFKIVCPNILSNPLVQIPVDVLPADYSPGKYDVTGDFLYTITVKEK